MAAAADRRPPQRLGKILLRRVLLAGLALTAVLSILAAGLDYRRRVADLQGKISQLEVTHGRVLAESLWKLDRQLVEAQADSILNIPYVVHVAIVEKGVTTHENGRRAGRGAIKRELPLSYEHRGTRVPLGTLQIEADPALVRSDTMARLALILLFQLATVGITSAIMLLVFNRLVTRHFNTASRYFEAVAADGMPPPLRLGKTNRQDELDLLAESFNDLLERLNASQRNLRESERKYRDLVELTHDLVWEVDTEGRITFMSAASRRIYGREPEEMIGRPFYEFVSPEEVARDRAELERALASGEASLKFENRVLHRDGHEVVLLANAVVRRDEAGGIVGTVGTSQDVTERKRAEEALHASQQILENILNTISVRVFWKDKNLVYLGCNAAFARDAGFADPKDIVGKDDYQMGWRAQADLYRRDDREVIESGRPKLLVEEPQTTPGGDIVTFLTSKVPLRNAQGEIGGVLGTYLDITDRIRAGKEKAALEGQLRQSQKMEAIGRLAGGVAHDFNNLTAIVLGFGAILLRELLPEDPLRRSAEQIVAAGRRSAALVSQLLAFGRRQVLQPRVLHLNGLLQGSEAMFARLIGEDVELMYKLAADPDLIKADPGQVEQVIANLVVNARDAMPLGGRLTIETANAEFSETWVQGGVNVLPGKYVALSVTDSGSGMDQATLARLFEPFFTTKAKGKGTGLGLATTYGIVKQSGGYIMAESEPGKGTTFRIYLPQRDEEPEALEDAAVETVADAPRGNAERILLVEDETPLRELCATMLERLGYRVSSAAGGLEALVLVREQRLEPDMVLTDVIMPGMGGAELAQKLRSQRPGLAVIFMSGYPDEAIAPHGVLEPGLPFLQKPFSEEVLARKVREVLAGKTAGAHQRRRVLMIDDDAEFVDLVRHFTTKRGHAFEGVDSSAAALTAMTGQPFDVLLVDMSLPGTDGVRILREIRGAGHVAPAILHTGDASSADMAVLGPLGVVSVLEKSGRAEPLLQAIEAAGELNDRPGQTGLR